MSRPPGATPAIRFASVGKRFARHVVLREISLEVRGDECFGLVGVNGAGKTTCIKALLDFVAIDAGAIEIFGVSHRETRARAPLAFLPERFLPPYYLRGSDFLRYMARLHDATYSQDRVRTMCAALDLDPDTLRQPVREYSKGMAQKLGLVACFLADRALYVLDEPMSGLDPKARLLVKRHLHDLKRRGRSLFFSTHMLADVEELCDRMAILHDGELRFVGTPRQCLERFPAARLEESYLACIASTAAVRE